MANSKKILLLGSGELGKELVISAQRLGVYTIAVDRYANAPAHQVAHESHVIDMLDGKALRALIRKLKPDFIVPEIEAIRTEALVELEAEGFHVVPSAKAVNLTMNRDKIRDFASRELKIKTARYAYAYSLAELAVGAAKVGFPCVIKPVMSSSGKGQSVAKTAKDLAGCWALAMAQKRGDQTQVIVEEFIRFDYEITLLTIQQGKKTLFCPAIGHRQERGDYQESWQPQRMSPKLLRQAQAMAKKVTRALGGSGLFGVEFFVRGSEIFFSELSPRPHDTGMVTMITQDLNEFDLHLRAFLNLPIPEIRLLGAGASGVILAPENVSEPTDGHFVKGVEKILQTKSAQVRLFGKPEAKPFRRMGVILVTGANEKRALHQVKRLRKLASVGPK